MTNELEKTKEQLEESQRIVEEKDKETRELKQKMQHMSEELCELQASNQEERSAIHQARQVTVCVPHLDN